MVLDDIVESFQELPGLFADVATVDPISAVLVLMGAILVGVSMGAFGLLVLGAAVEFVTPDSSATTHP